VACVGVRGKGRRQRTGEIRTSETATAAILPVAGWLAEQGVMHLAMESTGAYWRLVFNVLDKSFEVIVDNALPYKTVPNRETDVKGVEWLAPQLERGLLQASFIPHTRLGSWARSRAVAKH
jgi:transposase